MQFLWCLLCASLLSGLGVDMGPVLKVCTHRSPEQMQQKHACMLLRCTALP